MFTKPESNSEKKNRIRKQMCRTQDSNDLCKIFIVKSLFLLFFGRPSHLCGWSFQPLSFNNKPNLPSFSEELLWSENGWAEWNFELFLKQVDRRTLVQPTSPWSQPTQSSQDSPLLSPCEVQNLRNVISYVCKASRLKRGKLHIV